MQDHTFGCIVHGAIHRLHHALLKAGAIVPAIYQTDTFFRQQTGTFFAAGTNFLAMLEDQVYISVSAAFFQLQCQTTQGNGMTVMAALMTMSGNLRYIRRINLITHRQRIQFCPESNPRKIASGMIASVKPFTAGHDFQSCMFLQKAHQMLLRPVLFQREFRMLMELMPQFDQQQFMITLHILPPKTRPWQSMIPDQ